MSALVERTLTGAVLIAVVLILRSLLCDRLPKWTFRALWSIALLHLLLPILPHSPLSLYNLGDWLMGRMQTEAVLFERAGKVIGLAVIPGELTAALPQVSAEKAWLFGLWLTGALFCAAFFLLSHVHSCRRFWDNTPIVHPYGQRWAANHPRIMLQQSRAISSPLAYGLLHPTILLPADFDWQEEEIADCVLLHEVLHLRRGDLWLKAGLVLAACLYWHSPFSWIMLCYANRDIELACDEAVLTQLGFENRRSYAMMLIRMEEQKSGRQMLASGFAKNALEARITAIMKAKKHTGTVILLSVLLCLCVITGFAANGEEDRLEEKTIQTLQENQSDESIDIGAQLQTVIKPEAEPELEPEKEPFEAEPEGKPSYDPEAESVPATWIWPVPVSNNITGHFGARIHPVTGEKMVYDHITIAAEKDILAAQSGKVMEVFFDSYSGNTVAIEHIGYVTMYGHLAEVNVRVGQYVEGGAIIGTAGKTGQATGNCLAFWVSQNGTTVDPLKFYSIEPKITTGEEIGK